MGIDSVGRKEDAESALTGTTSAGEIDVGGVAIGADDSVNGASTAGGDASGAVEGTTSAARLVSVEAAAALPCPIGGIDVDGADEVIGFAAALDGGVVRGAVIVGSTATAFAGGVTAVVAGALDVVGTVGAGALPVTAGTFATAGTIDVAGVTFATGALASL